MPKRPTRRRTRSDVLWCLAGFCAFQLGLNVAVEHWRPEYRDPEYGTKRQLLAQQQVRHPNRPLALVLGSSRVLDGLRPELLPAFRTPVGTPLVFNYGLTGATPVEQLLVLRRLLKNGQRPRWVVIELMPSMLSQDTTDAMFHIERQSWDDLCVLRSYAPKPFRLARAWLSARLAPWFSCRFCLLSLYFPRWVPDANRIYDIWTTLDRHGWMPLRPSGGPETRRRGLAFAHYQHAYFLQHFHITPVMDRACRDLLELCRRERIAAALLVMPESSIFRSWYSVPARQLSASYLDILRAAYGVPVIDARTWVADDLFCDGHHLLPEGAEVFTRRFGQEALAPFLAESLIRARRGRRDERREVPPAPPSSPSPPVPPPSPLLEIGPTHERER
jgi:hypothetical protein